MIRLLLLCVVVFIPLTGAHAESSPVQSSAQWQEIKGDHFIICYLPSTAKPADSDYPGDIARFAEDVAHSAERYYIRIAADIGYARSSEFWTWDNRVRIYIYPDHASYVTSGSFPSWSQGAADYTKKQISSYAFSRDFLSLILPHELAHLIFRDFVGFKGEVPRWIDEGVAQWEEDAKRAQLRRFVTTLYNKDALLSIADMMKLQIDVVGKMEGLHIKSIITKNGTRGVLFLTGESLVSTYYAQSVSLVGFLIERYGSDDFAHFCRQLRDGKSLEEALSDVYPRSISNLEDFEEQWRKYLAEKL
jgi:hypothetical protein